MLLSKLLFTKVVKVDDDFCLTEKLVNKIEQQKLLQLLLTNFVNYSCAQKLSKKMLIKKMLKRLLTQVVNKKVDKNSFNKTKSYKNFKLNSC